MNGRPPKRIKALVEDLDKVMEAQCEAERNIEIFETARESWAHTLESLRKLATKLDNAVRVAWNDHYGLQPAY